MNRGSGYGAIILAAGLSSRMGELKPLLRLGPWTVLERLASSLRSAGVQDVVVVTGHRREEVHLEIERLDLREAHNPDYEMGMFTSVQAGVRSLGQGLRAFFVLPVDCALVGTSIFADLIGAWGETTVDVLHPTCCGRRGHPPLIAGRLAGPLGSARPDENLRSLLHEHAPLAKDVEVQDLAVLLDMDTPEDFRRMTLLAAAVDRRADDSRGREPRLTDEMALHLLTTLAVEDRVMRHQLAVASVATTLAEELNAAGHDLDVALVRSAALLHDIAKGSRRHAATGQAILARLGLEELGQVVGAHMVLPEAALGDDQIDERQVVYLADKLVVEDRPGDLATRTEYALKTYGHDEISRAAIRSRIRTAAQIAAQIEAQVGRSLEDILRPHHSTRMDAS